MKKTDRYLNYTYLLALIALQIGIIYWYVSDYDHWYGQISAFSTGLKGNAETFAMYGGPEKLQQAEFNYWLEMCEMSLFVIVPLIIGLFRLRHSSQKGLTILYYIIFGLYFCLFCLGICRYFTR